MLELVRHALPSTAEGEPLSIMYLAVVRTHMIRRETLPALRALAEMEDATGRVAGADLLVSMLDMCAVKPAEVLTSELEEAWSQIEVGANRRTIFTSRCSRGFAVGFKRCAMMWFFCCCLFSGFVWKPLACTRGTQCSSVR